MTSHYFYCSQCNQKYPTHQKLFETLYNFSKGFPEACSECGCKRTLHLNLDFQLGVGDGDFKVVSALLPNRLESWLGEEEQEVTFYPFLIVLEAADGKRFCWMPYWHVTGKDARYGQHAVCLEVGQFDNLIEQVQEKMLEPV